MNYWLAKTEPETFGWDDMIKAGTSMWDGVRNFQARVNLKKMKLGDIVLFYHSGKNPGIVGLSEVVREHYPDPTATEGPWLAVDVKPVRKFNRFITLKEIKQIPELKDMYLVRAPRLSVQPVSDEQYNYILELEKKPEAEPVI